ncbi:MAG: M48 family metallopeptidase [Abditibacteriota bacterium]|nr:M48 family metallopeptidase [Abditibacteriota bacterium]
METINIIIDNKTIPVSVERKDIKRIILKVTPLMEVKVSAPKYISCQILNDFLNEKTNWIKKKLDNFSKTEGYASTIDIKTGSSFVIDGMDYIIEIKQGETDSVALDYKKIIVFVTDINNKTLIKKTFDSWWNEFSIFIIKKSLDKMYPIVAKHNIPYPSISLRTMKTMWGNCNIQKHKIVFNRYLCKGKVYLIEYVVLHELVHFLYPKHNKLFYDFLSIHMPDWKQRKKELDLEVVHGL